MLILGKRENSSEGRKEIRNSFADNQLTSGEDEPFGRILGKQVKECPC